MDREFKMHVYPFQACFDPPTSKKSSNLAIICVFCQKAPDEVTPRCLKYQPLGANTLKCANFSRRSKCDKESALQARPDCWVDFIVMCEAFLSRLLSIQMRLNLLLLLQQVNTCQNLVLRWWIRQWTADICTMPTTDGRMQYSPFRIYDIALFTPQGDTTWSSYR